MPATDSLFLLLKLLSLLLFLPVILIPIPARIRLVSFEPYDSADRILELYLVFGMSVLVTNDFVVDGFGVVDGDAAAVVVVVVDADSDDEDDGIDDDDGGEDDTDVDDEDAINVCCFSSDSDEPKFWAWTTLSRSIFFELDECGGDFSNRLCD